MGADGTLYIFDADAIDAAGLREKFFEHFTHAYSQTIFERRVYTAYEDTEGRDLTDRYTENSGLWKYEIDSWTVWS